MLTSGARPMPVLGAGRPTFEQSVDAAWASDILSRAHDIRAAVATSRRERLERTRPAGDPSPRRHQRVGDCDGQPPAR
jgi:hypothetical protein